MRTALLVVFAVLATVLAAAPVRADVTRAVCGRVVSVEGRPVAGASISAGSATAIADNDGGFSIESVLPGSVGLLVVADGYLPTVVTVTEGDCPAAIIALSPADDASTGEVIEIT